jgi:hypothetical protein
MNNKKAQMQMVENIAILIVIVFILMFGFIFYSRLHSGKIVERHREYSELELVEATQKIINLPELSCSIESVVDVSCVNKLKAEAFLELNLTKDYFEYYNSMFGFSRVSIKSVFPDNNTDFLIYENKFESDFNEDSIFVPITIYDSITQEYNFGYIQVTKFTRIFT